MKLLFSWFFNKYKKKLVVKSKAQDGKSKKKRLFQLKEDSAIINRMGYKNGGVNAAVERLKRKKTELNSASHY
ncbi:hypothetical protein H1R16_08095 [Marnyiella aurantia]|uniref:Uncharacterized protein n=1 Tax=Marnyiella aurantia TaxID=2758037 RepID=A0A7D7QM38_9FLAO|nr:hypothetical protein [Marnyiella aurantia]MBP0611935.1 hypothetical protein [Marnyiella aurantia]QMS99605.1 hypothetical protein H1R16_08095 [Marnyiella aurantia]